jgi:lipid A 3-O-deacylase
MIRIIFATFVILTGLFCTSAIAQDDSRTFVFDVGRSSSNASRGHSEFDIYRVGVQKAFKRTFWEGSNSRLSGYWEGSLNYWSAEPDDVFAVALSPVFVLSFGEDNGGYHPFIEAGVGLAILSDDVIGGRQMGSSWQFEDRIGFGIKSDKLGFHYRYMHYSNGDLSKPNQGIDAHVLGMTYRF